MAFFVKHIVRIGVIGGLCTGAAVAIAGPDRIAALFTQTRNTINSSIDAKITDPVALRAQLRDLEAQYPKRIADVRGDLAELREQLTQLRRDLAVSTKVVSLADQDRDQLIAQLDRAQAETIRTVSLGEPNHIVVVFKGERLDVPAAAAKAEQAAATRNAYASRAAEIEKNLDLLARQEQRLVSILSRLETERTTFQAQIWNIDQEVDSIARNDRMIDIVSKWQQSIDEQSRYKAGSLDHIKSRLADVRARQEAKLDYLASAQGQNNYEIQAKTELDRENASLSNQARPAPSVKPTRRIIEIHPEPAADLPASPSAALPAPDSVAVNRTR